MCDLLVRSSAGDYAVSIGVGSFAALLGDDHAAVVADRRLLPALAGHDRPVVAVDACEERKTLQGCEDIVVALREWGVRRGERVLAVGGGAVQDLATLAASIYLRGIPWAYAPTTLMAMADSCVGGKSSINVAGYKNLVGNIYPPDRIVIDPRFLDSLDSVALACGLCEAVKIAYCGGPDAFARHLDLYRADWRSDPELGLVAHALEVKRWFVEIDEHDRRERRQLNFGHTFGHALETATDFTVPHGVAVGIGILAACNFASTQSSFEDELQRHILSILEPLPYVGAARETFDADRFISAFLADKKHRADALRLIVPGVDGGVTESEYPVDEVIVARVLASTREALELVA